MPVVVQSLAGLVDIEGPSWPAASYGSLRMYDGYYHDYATLYRVQPFQSPPGPEAGCDVSHSLRGGPAQERVSIPTRP